jgi:hypothetical protein
MDDESPQSKAAHFRSFAQTLQGTANKLLDLRRRAQLLALADGFERYADGIEQAAADGAAPE